MKGLGDESLLGGKDGDLKVNVRLIETDDVKIVGSDLVSKHFVTLGEAIEGKEITVKTLRGHQTL